jgi:protein-S-isoprenylcysteine O-methyltransferase Ste14
MADKRRILPLMWLALSIVLVVMLHRRGPGMDLLAPPWTWTGLAPGVFGLWMMAVSARSFRKADTGLVPFDEATVLVTSGFFRYTRNPMYLGMVLLLVGVAILHGSAAAFLPVPLFALIIHRNFVLAEERFMERAFGDAYRDYRERVRRWL